MKRCSKNVVRLTFFSFRIGEKKKKKKKNPKSKKIKNYTTFYNPFTKILEQFYEAHKLHERIN